MRRWRSYGDLTCELIKCSRGNVPWIVSLLAAGLKEIQLSAASDFKHFQIEHKMCCGQKVVVKQLVIDNVLGCEFCGRIAVTLPANAERHGSETRSGRLSSSCLGSDLVMFVG
ncbi:hypothetical protein Plhal304r1_c014g0051741 [Plasmopara halstedii]